MNEELNFAEMSDEELIKRFQAISGNTTNTGSNVSTDTQIKPETVVAPEGENRFEGMTRKEKLNAAEPGELIPGFGRKPREGVGGFVQDTLQNTGESLAPAVGVLDTITDVINMASPNGIPDIPKVPEYEAKSVQAVRNISGLIIPSLGLRSLAIQGFSKIHAAGKAAPWLQKLGNSKSFSYFSKFGIDIGTGGFVDYAAEQNQKDDNLLGTLKGYWPKTFQWIPESVATDADDTPGEKRAKNVGEGAIFNVLSSIIEGAAYLTKAGRSIKRTSQFIPAKEGGTKNIDTLTKDEFTDIKFSDNPIEDNVLRGS